jgi:hypothetical protein
MINTLDDLKIQGIRPKPAGIAAELKKSGNLRLDPLDFVDLQSKGFILASDPQGNQQLVSNEGEVIAATNQGVVYSLYFGEIFTGSALDIEVGNSGKEKDKKPEEKSKAADSAKETDKKADEKADDGALKTSRYLFVTVTFDPSFIGDPPQKPAEPKKPAGLKEKTDNEKKEETKPADQDKKEDKAKAEEKPSPEAEYEIAMKKYQSELKTYEKQLKEYDEKVVKGNELVQQLNERFANWYYVISANSFETLRMSRKALIEPVEKPKEDAGKSGPANPTGGKPAAKPAGPTTKPAPAPAPKPAPSKTDANDKPDQPAAKPNAGKPEAAKPKTKPTPPNAPPKNN